jgi:magnesium transporter
VISHRQNEVLRILTVFSVLLLPLTVITGIFGMNVKFPGFDTHHGWWVVVGIMVAVLVSLVGFFKYKRWI